jgi:hypothetical protein
MGVAADWFWSVLGSCFSPKPDCGRQCRWVGVLSPAPRRTGQCLIFAGELFQWVAKACGDPLARRSERARSERRREVLAPIGTPPLLRRPDRPSLASLALAVPAAGELPVATAWATLLHSQIAGTRTGTRNPKGSE